MIQLWAGLPLDRPLIMGILNVTPDSFTDGGAYPDARAAIAAGLVMREQGANLVDVGGESTRPGATPVPAEIEQARVVPVIRALAKAGVVVSADTRNAATMARALDAGARIINDVSALGHDPAAAPLLVPRDCGVILMHMRGVPATMTGLAHYDDVVADVARELAGSVAAAERAGIARARLAIDPGFGFAKRRSHSLALLRGLGSFTGLGLPILVGVSRKGLIGDDADHETRDILSIVAGLFALDNGANILRVHNVLATVEAVKLREALVRG